MLPELIDSWLPVDETAIRQFEEECAVQLPSDYRRFLLAHNGGTYADDVRLPDYPKVGAVTDTVGYWYSLHELRPFDRSYRGRRIAGLIAIGSCGNGCPNEVVLCCRGKHAGRVFLINGTDLLPVCESFTRLMEGLRLELQAVPPDDPPIFRAIAMNDTNGVDALLRDGAPVDSRNAGGETCLMHAARYHRPTILRRLLEAGAEVDAGDSRGWTALVHAVRSGMPQPYNCVDCVAALLAHGANVDVRVERNSTLLMEMLKRHPSERPLELLLEYQPDINAINDFGETPLSCCAWLSWYSCDSVLTRILEAGPDEEPAIAIWRQAMGAEGREFVERLREIPEATKQRQLEDEIDPEFYVVNAENSFDQFVTTACLILRRLGRADVLRELARGPERGYAISGLAAADPSSAETAILLRELFLSSPDETIRYQAVSEMWQLTPDVRDLSVLRSALTDSDETVRDAAESALQFLESEEEYE